MADLEKGVEAHKAGDYIAALHEFRPLAEQGDAEAQSMLGFMYHHGEGVAQDDAQAVKWHRKAAGQGNADGQYNLGVIYATGKGVAQDYTQAAEWYRKAAGQGVAWAQAPPSASCITWAKAWRRTTYRHTCGTTLPRRRGMKMPPSTETSLRRR